LQFAKQQQYSLFHENDIALVGRSRKPAMLQ